MTAKLDSQGWIDATTRTGRAYAFFVRNGIIWVRRNDKYKWAELSGCDTIAAARALAGKIAGENEFWQGERVAKKAGLPSD
jgi:hypothetical protein